MGDDVQRRSLVRGKAIVEHRSDSVGEGIHHQVTTRNYPVSMYNAQGGSCFSRSFGSWLPPIR